MQKLDVSCSEVSLVLDSVKQDILSHALICTCSAAVVYRLSSITYVRRNSKQMIAVEQLSRSEMLTIAVQDFSHDLQRLNGFSPQDAFVIGYVAGMESVVREQ